MPVVNPPVGGGGGATAGYVDRGDRTAWRPTATFESFSRLGAPMANVGVLSTGRLSAVAGVVLPGGVPFNTISFFSGTTAVVTPTNQWFCLLDASLNVLAKTVDDTTTAWAANVKKSLALSATYTPGVDTPVYVGIMVAAATVPSMSGISPVVAGAVINALAPITSGISTTGLTDPASLGATAAALTAIAATPYAQVS